jgi:prephenate dehydratase
LGDYLFFLDIEAPRDRPAMAEALAVLAEVVETLKIFGSYTIGDREGVGFPPGGDAQSGGYN